MSSFAALTTPLRRLTLAAAFVVTVSASATASADSGAVAFVQKLGDTAIADLTDPKLSDSARVKRMRTLLANAFDVVAVSRFVLGPYMRRTTPEQFKDFTHLYEIYVAHNYAGLFKRYNGEKVEMQSERDIPGGDIAVYGIIKQEDGPSINIAMRVRKENGGYKAVDLKVEGVSMPLTHRKQFASVIAQHNGQVSGLIDALRAADNRFEKEAPSQ